MQRLATAVLIGFGMLLALPETVSAYYSSERGRFVSRDPIGTMVTARQGEVQPAMMRLGTGGPTSPVTGARVVSRDPLPRSPYVDGPNLYEYAKGAPLRYTDPTGLRVEICCAPIDVGSCANTCAKLAGLKHCWIKTSTKAAGQGPLDDGPLPKTPCCGTETKMADHTGRENEPGAKCYAIPFCDEECVNREIVIGQRLGKWSLIKNQCNAIAQGILDKCKCKDKCLKWEHPIVHAGFGEVIVLPNKRCIKWKIPANYPVSR